MSFNIKFSTVKTNYRHKIINFSFITFKQIQKNSVEQFLNNHLLPQQPKTVTVKLYLNCKFPPRKFKGEI